MTYFFRHGNSATSQRRQTTDLGWGCLRRSPAHDGLQRQVPRLECSWSARGAAQPLAGADLPLLPHSRVQAHPRARGARPLRPPRALLAAPPSTSCGHWPSLLFLQPRVRRTGSRPKPRISQPTGLLEGQFKTLFASINILPSGKVPNLLWEAQGGQRQAQCQD